MNVQYEKIAEKILQADAILIGASNGLSITEGLNLFADDEAFESLLGDYKKKYGFRRILDGFFYHWETEEEKWGYFSRLINHYSGHYTASQVMEDLKIIVGEKPYFVLTSNGEGHFELAGFDSERVYELEGNWIEMRCGHQCHDKTYPSLSVIREMAAQEKNGLVPAHAIPRCPVCGCAMELYNAQPPKKEVVKNWQGFRKAYHDKKLAILELGIGWRNQMIKAPLMQITDDEAQAVYITINLGEIYIPEKIQGKSYGLDGYLSDHLKNLRESVEKVRSSK